MLFEFDSKTINLEIKYIAYKKIFSLQWKLKTLANRNNRFQLLAQFLNEKYPLTTSLLGLDIDKAEVRWIDWLDKKGYVTIHERYHKEEDKTYQKKTKNALFLRNLYKYLMKITDERVEWEKDIWDVRNLNKFGIDYNPTNTAYKINFSEIKNEIFKENLKEYFKLRLLARNHFNWSTALTNIRYARCFMNFLSEREPHCSTFEDLTRQHIENYLEYLNARAVKRNAKNISEYIHHYMGQLKLLLDDLQIYEFDIAYKKNINRLIRSTDIPSRNRERFKTIKFIPDCVIDQLLTTLDALDKRVQPIVWIMFKTGLRISDVLSLQHNCLIKVKGKYMIETDIRKTNNKDHTIPIDNELADMIALLIHDSKEKSNELTNPNSYLFCTFEGRRKGKPYTSSWVRNTLNIFARENNITDDNGEVYYFKNHAFRHTYAVRMINNGVDLVTIQSLLAHASPRMTMTYARIVDDTKRKQFDKAVKNGAFSFTRNGDLVESPKTDTVENIMETLWTQYKLEAVDTPYGLCVKKANGRCNFAQLPPCLTRDGGSPCKDLCVTEKDLPKYKVHIESVKNMIRQADIHGRDDWKEKNQDLLGIYENIYAALENGNVIYGRQEG